MKIPKAAGRVLITLLGGAKVVISLKIPEAITATVLRMRALWRGAFFGGAILLTASGSHAQNFFTSVPIYKYETGGKGSAWVPYEYNILQFTPSGGQSIFATVAADGTYYGLPMAFDSTGDLFVADSLYGSYTVSGGYVGGGTIYEFVNNKGTLNSTPITFASGLGNISSLAFDSAGDLFVADRAYSSVFGSYINILEFTPSGTESVFAALPADSDAYGPQLSMVFDHAGDLFLLENNAYNTSSIFKFENKHGTLDSTSTTFASGLNDPLGFACDRAGDLFVSDLSYSYVTDSLYLNILEITTSGNQSIIASEAVDDSTSYFQTALAFDPAGDLFILENNGLGYNHGHNTCCIYEVVNNNGTLNSTPITFASGLNDPTGLAFQPVALGIDVSSNQGLIMDWPMVKASGVSFAFVRATLGGPPSVDVDLDRNVRGFLSIGVPVGVYHLAYPTNNCDPIVEAKNFLNFAGQYIGNGFLPPVLDIESAAQPVGNLSLSQWITDWILYVQQQTGVAPIIYANTSTLASLDPALTGSYNVWASKYDNSPTFPSGFTVPANWLFKQYAKTGTVCGIPGNAEGYVDLDSFLGNPGMLSSLTDYPLSPTSVKFVTGINGGPLQPPQNGKFTLEVVAPGQQQVNIQQSEDLINWVDMGSVNPVNGTATVTDPNATTTMKFYRVKP